MNDYIDWVTRAQTSATIQEKHDAFDSLMKRFHPMAYKYAYATLHDSYMAEDATQEAFISAYRNIGKLREPQAFPAWLRRIVFTQCNRLIRGKKPIIEPIETHYSLQSGDATPEEWLEDSEIKDQLHLAINALPEHERDVTESFYLQGESQKEIAEKLHIPVTTVKKRLQYARQRLRVFFSDVNETIDWVLYPDKRPQPQPQPVYVRSEHEYPPYPDNDS